LEFRRVLFRSRSSRLFCVASRARTPRFASKAKAAALPNSRPPSSYAGRWYQASSSTGVPGSCRVTSDPDDSPSTSSIAWILSIRGWARPVIHAETAARVTPISSARSAWLRPRLRNCRPSQGPNSSVSTTWPPLFGFDTSSYVKSSYTRASSGSPYRPPASGAPSSSSTPRPTAPLHAEANHDHFRTLYAAMSSHAPLLPLISDFLWRSRLARGCSQGLESPAATSFTRSHRTPEEGLLSAPKKVLSATSHAPLVSRSHPIALPAPG